MPGWQRQPRSTVWEKGYLLQFLGTVQPLWRRETPTPTKQWKGGVSHPGTLGLQRTEN